MLKRRGGTTHGVPIVREVRSGYQLRLSLVEPAERSGSSRQMDPDKALRLLLSRDLSFAGQKTAYATHNLHAFAAKFPPQLPRLFIQELTRPGALALDPMLGSGTALVEAVLTGRMAIGVDLDPLAALIAGAKSNPPDLLECRRAGAAVLHEAIKGLHSFSAQDLRRDYAPKALEFFHYWFEDRSVPELYALVRAIERVRGDDVRAFLKVIFSSMIITKSGGITRARDLAHSRPHRDMTKHVEHARLLRLSHHGCIALSDPWRTS